MSSIIGNLIKLQYSEYIKIENENDTKEKFNSKENLLNFVYEKKKLKNIFQMMNYNKSKSKKEKFLKMKLKKGNFTAIFHQSKKNLT